MTTIETISIIASLASLILAIVAIWLSFKFFEKSSEAAEKTIEASKGISSSVERLENLFDKLYTDTFTMMKDTVSDMRKHIWNKDEKSNPNETHIEEELEKKAQEKVDKLKIELSKEMIKMFDKQNITDTKISNLKSELTGLIEKAVSQTRNLEIEAREETLRDYILRICRFMKRRKRVIQADDIVESTSKAGFSTPIVLDELLKMKLDGLIDFEKDRINGPHDEIKLL